MPKGKGGKKKPHPKQQQAAVQRAVANARKKWEFNLIKTGNNSVQYNSNNGVRSRGLAPGSISMLPPPGAVASLGAAGEIAVTNKYTALRDQIVEEDEVIGVVSGNTGFEASVLAINPGLAGTFPWLSVMARLFERYAFESLVVYYKPLGSGFATNNQVGKVILCADYDATESTPASYRQAETMDPHADGMPFQAIELHLDPSRLNRDPKFVRVGPPPPATDIKTYDAASFYMCVQGTTNSSDIGELRVRYRVRMMNPRLPSITAQVSPNNTVFAAVSTVGLSMTSGAPTICELRTLVANGVGATYTAFPSQGTVGLLQGNYKVTLRVTFIASVGFTHCQAAVLVGAEAAPADSDIIKCSVCHPGSGLNAYQQTLEVVRYVIVDQGGAAIKPTGQMTFATGTGALVTTLLITSA